MAPQPSYGLHCEFEDGKIEVSLQLTPRRSSRITKPDEKVTIKHFKTEGYMLAPAPLHADIL